jgi:hypothetical protein
MAAGRGGRRVRGGRRAEVGSGRFRVGAPRLEAFLSYFTERLTGPDDPVDAMPAIVPSTGP